MAEMDVPTSPAASASASDSAAGGSPSGPDRAALAEEAPAEPDLLLTWLQAMPADQRAACSNTAFDANVKSLRREREALAKQKREITSRVRNEMKKKSRMLAKANRMTNNELLQVFAMRMKNKEARASSSEPQGERP